MLKSKTILTISVLAALIGLTACQPKDKEPQTPATQTTAASEAETVLKLVGDTEKLQFELPECDGNACPELNIDRLQSNQAFIDAFIDQKIIDDLSQIIDISPVHSSHDAEFVVILELVLTLCVLIDVLLKPVLLGKVGTGQDRRY